MIVSAIKLQMTVFFLREAKVLQYIISSPGEQIEPC